MDHADLLHHPLRVDVAVGREADDLDRSGRSTFANPQSSAAVAASGAKPLPQCCLASRQPTSTHGVNIGVPAGRRETDEPDQLRRCRSVRRPTSRTRRSRHGATMRSIISSLCCGVSIDGKWRMTSGSPFSCGVRRSIAVAPLAHQQSLVVRWGVITCVVIASSRRAPRWRRRPARQ